MRLLLKCPLPSASHCQACFMSDIQSTKCDQIPNINSSERDPVCVANEGPEVEEGTLLKNPLIFGRITLVGNRGWGPCSPHCPQPKKQASFLQYQGQRETKVSQTEKERRVIY